MVKWGGKVDFCVSQSSIVHSVTPSETELVFKQFASKLSGL